MALAIWARIAPVLTLAGGTRGRLAIAHTLIAEGAGLPSAGKLQVGNPAND